MADYVETAEDNGGVHINSGIPNRAFALAAIAVGGSSWERAGRVWYDALSGGTVDGRYGLPRVRQRHRRAQPARSSRRAGGRRRGPRGMDRGGGPRLGVASGTPRRPCRAAETVARVRRSGGFAGTVRSAELDLALTPRAMKFASSC